MKEGKPISVRFKTHELERIRRGAAELGLSVSAFIRSAALSKSPLLPPGWKAD